MTSPEPPQMTAAPIEAPRVDSTQWYSGASVALELHAVSEGIRNRDWVEGGIGALGLAAEGVGMVVDPIGTLASYGVGWMMEHVEPLSKVLDMLAGDPDQVAAYAQTWHNIATVTDSTAYLYAGDVRQDLPSWQDHTATMYRQLGAARTDTFDGLTQAAQGMSGLAEAVGMVVGAVRAGVRALISLLVGKLISWAIELGASLGLATPLVVAQATAAVAQTATRVFRMVSDLMASLKKLHAALQKYKMLITALRVGIGATAGRYAYAPYGD
ncbi:MAG TPA: hypothetical protein VF657_21850 [Actinoplanes sp.]|jgi:hypothetical protein